ncbi:MAG: hypothetical protein CML13_10455 [Puniceicoccaceae bacterium]|nr:hypothetical protein [Puniceicoccaceae bacterium]
MQSIITELNKYLRGWWGWFSLIETPSQLSMIGGWIRRRLRSYIWKQWFRGLPTRPGTK